LSLHSSNWVNFDSGYGHDGSLNTDTGLNTSHPGVLQFRSTAYLKNLCPCFIKLNFLYMVPVAVAQFSSDNSAISYVFLVLWITSWFHIYITGICGVW